ncbi:MAG: hypothetical protein HQM13_17085 [SAR324 cluster bacterium]|nr:hypothetical protein [SAR324 cluster bacterium]
MKWQGRTLDNIEKVILTYCIGLFLAIVVGIPLMLYLQSTIGMAYDQSRSGKTFSYGISCTLPGYAIDPDKFLSKNPPNK